MIHKSFGIMIIFCFLLAFLPGQSFSAQKPNFVQLLEIAENLKLANSEEMLAPFYDGQEYINVLVSLAHSPEAEALSLQSTASVTENFQQAPGTRYFNLKDEMVKTQLRDTVRQTIDSAVSSFDNVNVKVTRKFTYVFGFAATVNLVGLQQLLDSERVVSVSEDLVLEPHLTQGIPLMRADKPRTNFNGSGVSIAIIDTGIDTSHPRLGNGGYPIFNSKVIGGYDVADMDADPRPGSYYNSAHGTACAGISAGNLGSVGDYIGGVAPGAKLYAIKISRSVDGVMMAGFLVTALEWAVTHQNDDPGNPIRIISASVGTRGFRDQCDLFYRELTQAAMNAVSAGITIFVSSGNDGYCDSISFPACISSVNSVGAVYDASFGTIQFCISSESCAIKTATDTCPTGYLATNNTAADKVTSYSNTANFLTILGPAHAAYTTDIVGRGGYSTGDYYSTFGGTSAACPYVAGAAAVLQGAAIAKTGTYLTPAKVKYFLTNFGDNITDGKVSITKPRVNLAASISQLFAPPPPPPGGEGNDKEFPWVLLQPIMNKKGTKPPPPANISQWGALDKDVCCPGSSLTFSVTLQGANINKSSTMESCSSTSASFSGYSNAAAGAKSFIWRATSATCRTYSGSFNFTFINNIRYLIQLEYDGGAIKPKIYSSAIPSNQTNNSKENLHLATDFMDRWVLEKTGVFPSAKSSGAGAFLEQCFPAK